MDEVPPTEDIDKASSVNAIRIKKGSNGSNIREGMYGSEFEAED
jgi:hypothetical protein